MVDVEAAIRAELDRLAPPERHASADWSSVRARAKAGAPRRRRWSRRRVAIAAPVLAAALLASAFTFSAGARSLIGLGTRPGPVLAESRLLVSGSIGNGLFAEVWAGPATSGGTCTFVDFSRSPVPPAHASTTDGGSVCLSRPAARAGLIADGPWTVATAAFPFTVSLSITRRPPGKTPNWVPPYVNGAVYAGLHAVRVRLEWKGGSEALALRGNRFVGGGPVLYKPPLGRLPFSVVAYDAAGRVVARHRLADPSLYLLTDGWRSFHKLYLAWEKTHPRHR
jgi:hypothetical protein